MDIPTALVQITQYQMLTPLISLLGFAIFLFLMKEMFLSPTKSERARKLTTDLYVIGTIRKFAKEDGIELEDEMKNLKRIEKWEKASRRDLDWNIEANLNEKVSAKVEKQITEIERE